jgi:type III pantothenate kinase
VDLTLDIGNSAAKGALFAGDELDCAFALDLDDPGTASVADWRRALSDALAEARPRRAGLSSVVPSATSRAQSALRQTGDFAHLLCVRADADLRLPFALAYRTPATLGADRLAAAAAAWTRYGEDRGRPVVVLDAGTALTGEAIRAGPDGGGIYEGGAITAGPTLAARALGEGTAQLRPPSPAEASPASIGKTTEEALQSGLTHGFLDTARGLLRRFGEALSPPAPVVVATGGWGALLHERLSGVAHYDPHLVLRGTGALLQRNAREP